MSEGGEYDTQPLWERFKPQSGEQAENVAQFNELVRHFDRTEYARGNPDDSETTITTFSRMIVYPLDEGEGIGYLGELQLRAAAADIHPAFSPLIVPMYATSRGNIMQVNNFGYEYKVPGPPAGRKGPSYNDRDAALSGFEELTRPYKRSEYIRYNPDGSRTPIASYEAIINPSEGGDDIAFEDFQPVAALAGLKEAFPPIVHPLHIASPYEGDNPNSTQRFDKIYLQFGYEQPTARVITGTIASSTPQLSADASGKIGTSVTRVPQRPRPDRRP